MSDPNGTRTPRTQPQPADDEHRVAEIVRQGPKGTVVVAGIATFIVFAIWFAFYFLVFLPRGVLQ